MKILVLTNLYPPHHIGGYELICQTVVDTLRQRRHSIAILTSCHRVQPAPERPDDPFIERSLTIHGLYGHPWRGIRELRWIEKHNNQALCSAIRRHQPELVYVWNMGGLSKSILFTLQSLDVPTVFYVSDHWISRLESDVWLRWWNRDDAPLPHRLIRAGLTWIGLRRRWNALAPTYPIRRLRFERIYFCSRALRDLTAAAGYPVNHAAVIYCPVHLRYFNGQPSPPRQVMRRLLYVGRLAQDKGLMTALRALALLRGGIEVKLSVYGRGEPAYEAELKRFAQEHQLEVTFGCADLEQMPRVYRDHDLLLFPSEWPEPFALTPLEAMACGLPVVGTTTGGSAELFRHGENGLIYTAGRPEELAERIRQFASNYPLRNRCALTGYSESLERYAAPVVVDQIEEYLRKTVRHWRSA